MDTERWSRVKKIFVVVLSMKRDDRGSYLEKACEGDDPLRKEVEALIAAHEESDTFLERPVDAALAGGDEEPFELPPDTRIGQYTLQARISTGGMGTVYRAVQESPRRTVALKVMREGIVSKAALRRFEYEAQILAGLDHPNIARVIESGTHHLPGMGDAPGMPYFVMEYIEGARSLTEFACNRKLETSARMRLFLQVCDAVHYGHRKGVIHRDLKPSNLLVDASGKVKIIDFGVARATDSDLALTTAHTAVGQLIGTLQYMSPEQCKADPKEIDIRSDVYSLGVVLYELLCKELPYDVRKAIVFEATRIIRETEPRRPSTLDRTLQRDVETIVLKALEKDRNQRYQTVAELAEDIERFLSGDVILAKPAGFGTRSWKRIKKNPVVSGALALAVLTILCSLAYFMFISYPQLKRERDFARQQREIAEDRYKQIIRLSDVKTLSDLKASAKNLWPTYPENEPQLAAWMTRADEVIARLEEHRETLRRLRHLALPYDEDAEQRSREADPRWREYVEFQQARDEVMRLIEERDDPDTKEALKERLVKLKAQITDLEAMFSKRRVWIFPEEGMDWQHNTLTALVEDLERFAKEERAEVNERLQFARTVVKRTIDDRRESWDEAIASIREEGYDGLVIEPKVGFIPLGKDPDSGLWEFAHLQTGKVPARDSDGRLTLEEDTGLVFVLIPGGAFDMGSRLPSAEHPIGSPNVDPHTKEDDGPVRRVTVSPFLLSKYEMTQGQWLRIAGDNPSMYAPPKIMGGHAISLLHPVEQVTWNDCVRVLDRLKLRLPSEAEWEYATRAGTTTVYWTGDDPESLAGAVNICDRFAKEHNGPPTWKYSLWLDDGHLVHSPVGIYRANPFGLHDVCGNVYEWCEDAMARYEDAPVDGTARMTRRTTLHIRRGGCWVSSPFFCRSSHRYGGDATYMNNTLGLRPAVSLD